MATKAASQAKIYYLVTFLYQPGDGRTPAYPINSRMYEMDPDKTKLEHFNEIMTDLHKEALSELDFRCTITDMKII